MRNLEVFAAQRNVEIIKIATKQRSEPVTWTINTRDHPFCTHTDFLTPDTVVRMLVRG